MDKVHVYICLLFATIKSTAGNKTRLFPGPFLILAEAFQNEYWGATEEIEMGGYVTVPVRPKWHGAVAQWIGLKSSDVTTLFATEHIMNKYSLLKLRSVIIAVILIANLLTLSILVFKTAQVNWKKWK